MIRYEQEFSDSSVDAMKNSPRNTQCFGILARLNMQSSIPALALRLFMHDGASAGVSFVEEARGRAQRTGMAALPYFLTCMEVEYCARIGDLARAEKLAADMQLEELVRGGSTLGEAHGWRERDAEIQAAIRLHMAQQHWDNALALARQLARMGESGGRLKTQIKGLIFCALAQEASEDMVVYQPS